MTLLAGDFETDPFLHGRVPEVFAAGLYDGLNYRHWYGDNAVADFLAAVVSYDKPVCYMHNGGKFDFHYFLEYATRVFMLKARIAKLNIIGATFIDSYALLPVPLAEHDKDTGFDYGIMEASERHKAGNKTKILEYLRRDVKSLYDMVSRFIDENGASMTMASASVKSLKSFGYEMPRISENLDSRLRPYYHGGRCQVFKHGHSGNQVIADINSAYPAAMLDQHPFDKTGIVERDTLPDNGVYFATIWANSTGAFPYKDKEKSWYPQDDCLREFHVTSHEIQAAEDIGIADIRKVVRCFAFNHTRDFIPYIEHHYERRMEAKRNDDKAMVLFHKLFMNSLYGKFGIDPRRFKDYAITDTGHYPGEKNDWKELYEIPGFDRTVWERPSPSDKFINVATSASITGHVRASLLRAIHATNPVYCDTDCVIASDVSSLDFGKELGKWSMEADVTDIWIAGKKLYAALKADDTWKIASKGVRLTPGEIRRIANGETITFRADAPTYSLTGGPTFITRKVSITH